MSYLKRFKKLIPGMLLGVCCSAYAANDLIPQLLQQGLQHYSNKKYAAAADYLGQVVDMDGSQTQARYYLVYSLSLSGDNEQALKHAQILASQNPNEQQYKTLVNQLNAEISRQNAAIQKAKAATGAGKVQKEVMLGGYQSLDKNSNNVMTKPKEDYTPRDITPPKPLTELQKAVRKIDEEQFDEAEKMLKEIVKKEPKNAEALYNLGVIEFGRYNYEAAIGYFKKATDADPKHFASFSNMADSYSNISDYVNAEKAYKKATEIKYDEFALVNLADTEIKLGKLKEAESIYEKVLAKSPNSSEASVGLAQIRVAQGRLNEAMDMVNTAIKGGATGEANYVKALILIANKMYSEANEEIAKALSVNGGSQKYILARATAFIRSMDFSRGLDDANAVLAANPDSVEARLLIAEGFLATSADSEAEAQLDEVDKKGKYGQAYRLRGQLAKKRGNADEAKNMYAKFFEMEGSKPACAYEYAEFLQTVNENSMAIDTCNAIIKAFPDTIYAENSKELLKSLSDTEEAPSMEGDSADTADSSAKSKYRPGSTKF